MNDDAWSRAKQIVERNSGGVFLRLNDGESFVGVFRGKPLATERHSLNANDRQPTRTSPSRKRAAKGRAR